MGIDGTIRSSRPNLSDSSIETCAKRIDRLYVLSGGDLEKPHEDLAWLLDVDELADSLKFYGTAAQNGYYTAVCAP